MEGRQSWEGYFMDMAEHVATRSTCMRRQVGAVAVDGRNRVIATGYNGPVANFPHCTPETCYRMANKIPSGEQLEKCYAVHAEQNLIVCAGKELVDAYVVVTHQPCTTCLKMLIAAGVRQIIWKNAYPDALAMDIMQKTGEVVDDYPLGKGKFWSYINFR